MSLFSPQRLAALGSTRMRVMLVVLLAAMPLAALLGTGAILARNDAVEANRHRALELARMGAAQQDSIVKEAKTLLTVVARLSTLAKLNPGDCFIVFQQIVADHPAVAALATIDDHGQAGCITANPAFHIDVSDRPFVRRLLQPGAVGFDLSDLVTSRVSGLPAIFLGLALPPHPGSTRPSGLLTASLNMTWLRNLSGVIGWGGGSSSAVLLDARDGTILASYPQLGSNVAKRVPNGPVLRAYRLAFGQPGITEGRSGDGVERILGFAPLPGTNNQIVLAVGFNRFEVLATANQRILLAFALMLGALGVAAGLAGFAAWLIVISPMAAFTHTASLLAGGDLLARVAIPRWHAPEVRLLANTLNTMAASVSDAQISLGKQTGELQATNLQLERLAVHLARARDKSEEASRAKSRFLAGMSHELRTPLNGILGYSQLLRDEGGLAPPQLARVEAMLGAGAHLLQMINRVLDMSEVEANHVRLCVAPLDLRGLASACLDLVRPAADAKGLKLGAVVAPGLPARILADETRLRQIVLNLLGNAVKFTQAGRISVRIFEGPDSTLRLEVADTGPGIPLERRHRLFQDFERLSPDAAEMPEGAGLGLAISGRLALLMGGTLGHEDNPGGGSVFWLCLPALSAEQTPEQMPEQMIEPVSQAQERQPRRALRVLVVDDVAMNRDVARSFLIAAGHSVECVESGVDAIRSTASVDHDVILMDVRMPGMDGLEATRHIRALPGPRGKIPVVALTAQAFAAQVEECRQAGMDCHLTKPYAPAALLAAVSQAACVRPDRFHAVPGSAASSGPSAAPHPVDRGACVPLPAQPIINEAVFERTAAFLKPDAVIKYLDIIADRCSALLQDLRAPWDMPDQQAHLADAAHTLAGSAGMFGFDLLTGLAQHFERALRSELADSAGLAGELAVAIEATSGALQVRRSRLAQLWRAMSEAA